MKTIILSFVFSMLFLVSAFSQAVYKLPYAGKDNRIELTVSNTSTLSAKGVNMTVGSCPSWIKMKSMEMTTGEIGAGKEETFTFNFDVDKTAPVGKEETIDFIVTSNGKQSWTKEIYVSASAPDKYVLFQNYPNPFNPTTKISYQLPVESRVTIQIYDVLGREVSRLVNDKEMKAGYYENNFNANSLSSGIYIYRLSAMTSDGTPKEYNSIKKMMLIK
ncbi:MAG: T9SS type A sorting domain-containing protein [Ignavibacteriaceae bacterium]